MSDQYRVVQLASGVYSLRSETYGETFHPVIGPVAEAQALYVNQLNLVNRVRDAKSEFVVWDIGLGAAANPLTFLSAIEMIPAKVRIVSFDYTLEPLTVALENGSKLGYLAGWNERLQTLLESRSLDFKTESGLSVRWDLHLGDFPAFLKKPAVLQLSKPHAIFYDAFSPATNPAMWTLGVFTDLFRTLDPKRACLMPTYSRSTMLRVTLLLAGFYVGKGHATGEKEETTLAANSPECIVEPLDRSWLMRCKRSQSAEPLHEPFYRQSSISDESWERLVMHPQFR
ncbi:MAG TPA: MnmC family methyltransferase [Candidatus Kapabacteria bacterium]|nr:MnmC family methyltransferase [Candidatus Kapabacteria bacterium]